MDKSSIVEEEEDVDSDIGILWQRGTTKQKLAQHPTGAHTLQWDNDAISHCFARSIALHKEKIKNGSFEPWEARLPVQNCSLLDSTESEAVADLSTWEPKRLDLPSWARRCLESSSLQVETLHGNI